MLTCLLPAGPKSEGQLLQLLLLCNQPRLLFGSHSLYISAKRDSHHHDDCACCLQDRKEKDSFFNWFYFAINLGSFLAVTTLVYVQESVSWTIGFAIPAAAMLLAVVTFVAGSSKYVHVEPTERYNSSNSVRSL